MPRDPRFDPPERFVAGTVGAPGQRTFFLQARAGARVVSVALEKQQVVGARRAHRRAARRADGQRRRRGARSRRSRRSASRTTSPLEQPIEEEFRAGTMTLSWDAADERIVIEVFPFTEAAVVEPGPGRGGDRGARARGGAPGPAPRRRWPGRSCSAPQPVVEAGRPSLPVLRQPDRPRRPPLRAGQRLPPPRPGDRPADDRDRARSSLDGRARRSTAGSCRPPTPPSSASSATGVRVRLQAGRGGAAAVGLPRRHARRPRGRGVRRLRGARLGRRAADRAARRARTAPAWCSCWREPDAGPGRRSTSCPEGEVPRATCTSSTALDGHDRPVSLVHEDTARAAPDGGLRRRGQQRRPQGRPRAGDGRRAPLRRRPRGLPSTSSTSCARCCGAGPATPLDRRGAAGARAAARAALPAATLGERRWRELLTDARGRRDRRGAASGCCAGGRHARCPRGGWPVDPVAGVLSAAPVRLPACVRGPAPDVPRLDLGTAAPVRVHDTATGALRRRPAPTAPARMYVCGITPYDATHMGHAATYVAFDLLNRAWRDAGHEVALRPERHRRRRPAARAGRPRPAIDWVELAERETELFREDMTALRVLAARRTTSARSSRSRWSSS